MVEKINESERYFIVDSMPLVICKYKHPVVNPKKGKSEGLQTSILSVKKYRKRIETLFSQLCDQFMIGRNYAKSFDGFKTRILAKITPLTTIQF